MREEGRKKEIKKSRVKDREREIERKIETFLISIHNTFRWTAAGEEEKNI